MVKQSLSAQLCDVVATTIMVFTLSVQITIENHYHQCCVTSLKLMTFVGLEPTTSKYHLAVRSLWCAILLRQVALYWAQKYGNLWKLGEKWCIASFLLHLTPHEMSQTIQNILSSCCSPFCDTEDQGINIVFQFSDVN